MVLSKVLVFSVFMNINLLYLKDVNGKLYGLEPLGDKVLATCPNMGLWLL